MFFEYFNIARKVLVAHKFRSLLTVLSITIGAFSIVLMSSLAESGLATLIRGIEEMGGARLIFIAPKPPEREKAKSVSYQQGLTVSDGDLLAVRLPYVVGRSMFSSLGNKEARSEEGRTQQADLVAGDGDFFAFSQLRLARGRFFTADENARHAKLCVVGADVADELWDGDAIGHILEVDGVRCRVIGQSSHDSHWGVDLGFDWLAYVAMPLQAVDEVDPAAKAGAQLWLKSDSGEHNEIVKRICNAILMERHNGVDDFTIFDMASIMSKFQSLFSIMETIVGFIAGIALLVGGVGVMNMMLVSVSERVREIGIRKALGASPSDIGRQFVLEAMALAGAGGALGTGAGVLVALAVSTVIHQFVASWVSVIAHDAVVSALAVSIGVGLVFGYFPARRAARLDAICAMRRTS